MLILRAKQTSLRSQPHSELGFGELVLLPITAPTRGKHVVDRIRASTRQRGAVVDLKRSDLTAVRALAPIPRDESQPLCARELTLCRTSTCPVSVALGSKDLGMRGVIGGHDSSVLLSVACVIETLRRTPLLGMHFAPATHGLACLLRIQLHPLARVSALPLRILVRHVTDLAGSQLRCNGTVRVLSCP